MKRADFGKEPEESRVQKPAPTSASQNAAPPAAQEASSAQVFIADHTVAANETLGSIALKYYGAATREKWMPIYEANKAIIGDNPGMLKVGLVLRIPKQEPA